MEPLFNLYGNPGEGEATQTQITDEDIQNAKKADQLSSVASIESHEILSPRDEPDVELLDYCSETVRSILQSYAVRDDRDSQKIQSLMEGKPFAFKAKALHKLVSDSDSTVIDTLQKLQMQPESALNCIAVTYHFEHTSEELGADENPLNPIQPDSRPFYQKHPVATVIGILALYMALRKK